ncbi:hypothetical protein JB92DRAFT_3020886, partial [Gautieria morchelliformis]
SDHHSPTPPPRRLASTILPRVFPTIDRALHMARADNGLSRTDFRTYRNSGRHF